MLRLEMVGEAQHVGPSYLWRGQDLPATVPACQNVCRLAYQRLVAGSDGDFLRKRRLGRGGGPWLRARNGMTWEKEADPERRNIVGYQSSWGIFPPHTSASLSFSMAPRLLQGSHNGEGVSTGVETDQTHPAKGEKHA